MAGVQHALQGGGSHATGENPRAGKAHGGEQCGVLRLHQEGAAAGGPGIQLALQLGRGAFLSHAQRADDALRADGAGIGHGAGLLQLGQVQPGHCHGATNLRRTPSVKNTDTLHIGRMHAGSMRGAHVMLTTTAEIKPDVISTIRSGAIYGAGVGQPADFDERTAVGGGADVVCLHFCMVDGVKIKKPGLSGSLGIAFFLLKCPPGALVMSFPVSDQSV